MMTCQTLANETPIIAFKPAKKNSELVPFLAALEAKKIGCCSDIELLHALSAGVSKAIFDLGHREKTPAEHKQMCNTLMQKIRGRLEMLTLDEIKMACENGAEGRYGDVIGVNVIQVTKWLIAYKNDVLRHKALKDSADKKAVKFEKIMTENDYRSLAIESFEKFKKSGSYYDYGNLIYDYLVRAGVLNLCQSRKIEIKNLVQKNELERLSIAVNLMEKRKFANEIREIIDGTIDLKTKCKHYALNLFYKDLVDLDLDLETQLTIPIKMN